MRLIDLFENFPMGRIRDSVVDTLPIIGVIPELDNGNLYLNYRFGTTLAAALSVQAGEHPYNKQIPWHTQQTVAPYTKQELDMVKLACQQSGFTLELLHDQRGREHQWVNTKSPVANLPMLESRRLLEAFGNQKISSDIQDTLPPVIVIPELNSGNNYPQYRFMTVMASIRAIKAGQVPYRKLQPWSNSLAVVGYTPEDIETIRMAAAEAGFAIDEVNHTPSREPQWVNTQSPVAQLPMMEAAAGGYDNAGTVAHSGIKVPVSPLIHNLSPADDRAVSWQVTPTGGLPQVLVVYPGRFQPLHRGHRAVYDALVRQFGPQVYLATSGRMDPDKSPFSYEDKQQMLRAAGIPLDHMVLVKNPYNPTEITSRYVPSNTVLVFAVGTKDLQEDPRFDFPESGMARKKDGSPAYLQKWQGLHRAQTMDHHGYVLAAPTETFAVLGKPSTSATEIRRAWRVTDSATRHEILTDLYGTHGQDLRQTFDRALPSKVQEVQSLDLQNSLHSQSQDLDFTRSRLSLTDHRNPLQSDSICEAPDTASEAQQIAAVQQVGYVIQYIKNPSPAVQLAAVQQDGWAIRFIKNPSPAVQLAAVQQDGSAIRFIKNPSPAVQLAAVQQRGRAIYYIKNPSPAVQLAAVQQNGRVIYYINNPSPAVQLAAVQQDGSAIVLIDHPSAELWSNPQAKHSIMRSLLTAIKSHNDSDAGHMYRMLCLTHCPWPELAVIGRSLDAAQITESLQDLNTASEAQQIAAVQQDGWAIHFIKNPSPAVQLAAVQQDGGAIQLIKNPSPAVQLAAVQQRGHAIYYINNPSPAVQLAAVQQDGTAIQYVKNPTPEMQMAAVQQNGLALCFIKNSSAALQIAALHQNPLAIRCFTARSVVHTEVWQDPQIKYNLMKAVLTEVRASSALTLLETYRKLRSLKCPWPELQIIDRSLKATFSREIAEGTRDLRTSAPVNAGSDIRPQHALDPGLLISAMCKFLIIAKQEIGLDQLPHIDWSLDPMVAPDSPSFGLFQNDRKVIKVTIRNRHPIDIMRTLAHELVHYQQDVEHRIHAHSGETGSPIENEANAMAGKIMRRFDQENPEMFALAPVAM